MICGVWHVACRVVYQPSGGDQYAGPVVGISMPFQWWASVCRSSGGHQYTVPVVGISMPSQWWASVCRVSGGHQYAMPVDCGGLSLTFAAICSRPRGKTIQLEPAAMGVGGGWGVDRGGCWWPCIVCPCCSYNSKSLKGCSIAANSLFNYWICIRHNNTCNIALHSSNEQPSDMEWRHWMHFICIIAKRYMIFHCACPWINHAATGFRCH